MALSRRALLAGTLGTATAALTACGSTQSNPLAGAGTELPTKPTTITWWTLRVPGGDGSDLSGRLIQAFQRRYPKIRVQRIAAPAETDSSRAALATQIAGGATSPDVFTGDVVWPAQFGYNSLALPLDSFLPEDFWKSYSPELVRALSAEGSVRALPLYIDQSFLYYRRDLLSKHGFRAPRSWEELADTATKIRKTGDVKNGFVWQGSVYEGLTCNVTEFIADAGGSVLSPDGKSVTVDEAPGVRALTFMRQLVSSGVTPSAVTTYIEQDALDSFTGGQSLFMRNWAYAWKMSQAPASKVAGKVGVMPRPGFEGAQAKGVSTIGGWHLYINPHTEKLGAALAFARFLAGEEGQMMLVRKGAVIPASRPAQESRVAKSLGNPVLARASDVQLVSRPTATPYYPKVSKAVYTNANSAISGSQSVQDALSAMSSRIQSVIEGAVL